MLPIVTAVLALCCLACAQAWQTIWISQQFLHLQSDLLHSQQLAEAVLPTIVQDIMGTDADVEANNLSTLRHSAGSEKQTHAFFPNSVQERSTLQLRLGANFCQAGICSPSTLNSLSATQWRTLVDQSMAIAPNLLPYTKKTVRYWVEVWLNEATWNAASGASPFIYRITVLVQDSVPQANTPTSASSSAALASGTLVLQTIWSRISASSPLGQWHSWKLLV